MKISLSEETAQRIRDALGDDVDLVPEVIPVVLARLAVEAPATYSQVLAEISGSQIRLDSEDELQRRRRRSLLRRLFFRWGEYETSVGDRLLAKREVTAAVPLAIAVLTLMLFVFSITLGHRALPLSAPPVAVSEPSPDDAAAMRRQLPLFVTAPSHPREEAPVVGPVGPIPSAAIAGALPIPARFEPTETPGFAAGPPGTPIVVSAPTDPAIGHGPPGDLSGFHPVVYNRAADAAPDRAPAAPGADPSPSNDHDGLPAAGSPLAPGIRITAALVTGVLTVPGGPPAPVVVQADDPPGIWVGQAVLGPVGRVEVTLTLVGKPQGHLVHGLALDPGSLVPGLSGRTSMQHPAAANAVAAATLQAAADYVQAVARQGTVNVFDGGIEVSGGQAAPAWTYVAARMAQELSPPGSSASWVPTIEIPAGARLIILITEAS
ncbi:MAG TPA: hypothetical protein VJT32_13035 [bacterium]|nr:hypothetical protein [bacterium]